MATLDRTMARCPLKHEIRTELWNKYFTKINKTDKNYLTLFSPPLMDVKFFNKEGHIKIVDYKYSDVVGVYLPSDHDKNYTQIISEGQARIGSLVKGDIDNKEVIKELKNNFPFDVINLDYCNYLYGRNYTPYVSRHMQAIDEIVLLQRSHSIKEFILFVTSRIDPSPTGFAKDFLGELVDIVNSNIVTYPDWKQKFDLAFNNKSLAELKKSSREDFITIGLTKLIALTLSNYNYKIIDTDAYRLVRDRNQQKRDLLHLAFHIKLITPVKTKDLAIPRNYEKESKILLNKYIDSKIVILKESSDLINLQTKHAKIIKELNEINFEYPTPEPIKQ